MAKLPFAAAALAAVLVPCRGFVHGGSGCRRLDLVGAVSRRSLLQTTGGGLLPGPLRRVGLDASQRETPDLLIDSHVHVWSNGEGAFPYAEGQEPDEDIRELGLVETLLQKMDDSCVSSALIVQPINHKFDHSYLLKVIKDHPTRFKGMCLLDPNQSQPQACSFLSKMATSGIVGVRFNPYLWPEGEKINNEVGAAAFEKAGDLGMAVGIMCFKGFGLHAAEIEDLVARFPNTKCIIDHMGFYRQNGVVAEEDFERLLELERFPNVYIKASAFFRNSQYDWSGEVGYPDVGRRLKRIIDTFGGSRVMLGSDYPFVHLHGGYSGNLMLAYHWKLDISSETFQMLIRGTAESVFGEWK